MLGALGDEYEPNTYWMSIVSCDAQNSSQAKGRTSRAGTSSSMDLACSLEKQGQAGSSIQAGIANDVL